MIRKFSGHDTDNPPGVVINRAEELLEAFKDAPFVQAQGCLSGEKPRQGCINYERPFVQAVEEYRQEAHQKALSESFEHGYRIGYQSGKLDAHRGTKQLDPTSEASR